MLPLLTIPLPFTDPATAFAPLAHTPHALLLDTPLRQRPEHRHAILLAAPERVLLVRDGVATLDGAPVADPFAVLREGLGDVLMTDDSTQMPFVTGWAGYIGYEIGGWLETLPAPKPDSDTLPDLCLADYPAAVVFDYWHETATLVARTQADAARLQALLARPAPAQRRNPPVAAHPDQNAETCKAAVTRTIEYIRDGDIYQANIAQRFSAPRPEDFDPFALFLTLRTRTPAPYMAYLNLPDSGAVVACSPEQFLTVRDGQVTTRPIKGTRPRGSTVAEDAAFRADLQTAAKDRAENLMIVDLLRNDLARVCRPGSVRVPALWEVESFPTVHHLVSTITGRLAPGRTALDALLAAFPGGSITGAPKIRAAEIIHALEPVRRGVYCGSIGYLGRDGQMDFNIAIRTVTCTKTRILLHAGGGIVADSDPEAEYQESLTKATALLNALAHP